MNITVWIKIKNVAVSVIWNYYTFYVHEAWEFWGFWFF